jgi:hypothetical protein
METLQLKNKVIHQIQILENRSLLNEVSRLLKIEDQADESKFVLTEAQTKLINLSFLQLANGQIFTNEEANHKIDKWLEK